MLRLYGPDCDGSIIDPHVQSIPESATWIDLNEPTREEEKLVERCIGVEVPTRDELVEIEPSSRLYEKDGVLYMTLSALFGVEEGHPQSEPIGFVLAGNRLVTVRYVEPKPIRSFTAHVRREPGLVRDAMTVLIRLLDAIIDRLADELEASSTEIEAISSHVFGSEATRARRIPATRLRALLARIGRAQSLLARIRETTISAARLISFLAASDRVREDEAVRGHVRSLGTDAGSLIDHSGFQATNINFLLDASLGLISIEQGASTKIFSVAAVIFMPPTMVAGVYGMNFEHMPELEWLLGYPMALTIMLMSAILPYWFFRRRGWL